MPESKNFSCREESDRVAVTEMVTNLLLPFRHKFGEHNIVETVAKPHDDCWPFTKFSVPIIVRNWDPFYGNGIPAGEEKSPNQIKYEFIDNMRKKFGEAAGKNRAGGITISEMKKPPVVQTVTDSTNYGFVLRVKDNTPWEKIRAFLENVQADRELQNFGVNYFIDLSEVLPAKNAPKQKT